MSEALTVGLLPSHFAFYQENMTSHEAMGDSFARIVMQRFRDAREAKTNNRPYQDKSTITLLREADYAMEKRYTPEMQRAITAAFGVCPTRYYGLSAAKTVSVANWKTELVAGDPGGLVQIVPTPSPRLPTASIEIIKEQVKKELIDRMIANGVGDPTMLIQVGSNRLHEQVKSFLDEKADVLRKIEQAKVVQAAMGAAGNIQNLMRDVIVEGDFREAYAGFSFNQIKYGLGIMRFPYWQRRIVLSDKQDFKGKAARKWKVVPTFQDVSPWNFFPTNDGRSVADNTACMEYREVNKMTLVGLMKNPDYDAAAIEEILTDYSMRSRTWLFPEASTTQSENGQSSTYWGPEELVGVVHHEGYVTGHDLQEYGLTGYEEYEIYNVSAEICCGRTIKLKVHNPALDLPRSYAVAKYEDLGHGVWNAVGIPGILQDTQDRVNVMIHCWENNIDWSLRPPLQTNSEALKNPSEARNIVPGGKYEISDMLGSGAVPDPIRTIRGPSAQYQILWPLIQQQIRQADSEVGIPELSDFTSLGRGSLGEFSARVSAAVRRVRSAAFSEDRSMSAVWRVLFEYVLDENPEAVKNADLDMNYIGVIGLLTPESERKSKIERLGLVMQGVQNGIAPPEVAKFAFQDLYKDMGIPTEELGFDNPLVSNAIAIATANGGVAAGTGNLAGAPQLDGRSGAMGSIPSAIAAPNGASQIVPPAGM